MAVVFRFRAGDLVEAQGRDGKWREARVSRREGYRGREGYYILWVLPQDSPSWVSRGGWHQGSTVRGPAPQKAAWL